MEFSPINMGHLDTSYIVRFFVRDVEDQYKLATKAIKSSKKKFLPIVSVAETDYVLRTHYKVKKQDVCDKLSGLINQPKIFTVSFAKNALRIYKSENISIYDSLIIAEAVENNSKLYTFDKKMNKIYKKYK